MKLKPIILISVFCLASIPNAFGCNRQGITIVKLGEHGYQAGPSTYCVMEIWQSIGYCIPGHVFTSTICVG